MKTTALCTLLPTLLACVCVLALPVQAKQEQISPDADWATALESLNPGDVALLEPGRYRGSPTLTIRGTSSSPITIRGYGARESVIDGAEGSIALRLDDCAHLILERVTITNPSRYGIDGTKVYDHLGDTTKYPDGKRLNEGLLVTGGSHHITIRHCRFEDIATRGILLSGGSDRVTIEENLFLRVGDDTAAGDVAIGGGTTRWTVRGNLMAGNVDGVVCDSAGSEGLIEQNLFLYHRWENAIDCKSIHQVGTADYWTTIRHNVIYGEVTEYCGVSLQNGSQGIRVYYNVIHGAGDAGHCMILRARSQYSYDECRDYEIIGNWFDAYDEPGRKRAIYSRWHEDRPATLENVWILHNVMTDFEYGVKLNFGENLNVYNNVFSRCDDTTGSATVRKNLYHQTPVWSRDSAPYTGTPVYQNTPVGPLAPGSPGYGQASSAFGYDYGRDVGIPSQMTVGGETVQFVDFDDLHASIVDNMRAHFTDTEMHQCTNAWRTPNQPEALQSQSPSSTSARLTWQDKSGDESGFVIERRRSGTPDWPVVGTPAANRTVFSDSGLLVGVKYYYRVKAYNQFGTSPRSNVATVPDGAAPPVAPDNLTASALDETRIGLAWRDRSNNEALFKIDRRQSGTSGWARIGSLSTDTTTHTDTGLGPLTKYYYKVKAWNSEGNSDYSDLAYATTVQSVPAAPAGLAAPAVTCTRIDLVWQDRSSNEALFKIDRRQSGTSGWARIATPAADSTAHSDTGLPAGTKLYYKIKAYNSSGNSAYTALCTARTLAGTGIPADSVWRYRKGTAEASAPPHLWRLGPDRYDDSGWAQGRLPLGYGDGPYNTELTDMRNNYTCVFLRKQFVVPQPALVTELRLAAVYDDGFILWLNGAEIARVNVPGAPGAFVAYDGLAEEGLNPLPYTLVLTGGALPALTTGTNVLAAQWFNWAPDSSDLTVDLTLDLIGRPLDLTADYDQDGLPDTWEDAVLSDLSDPSDQSDQSDPDNDGMSNLEEWIAGTSPVDETGNWKLETRLSDGQIVVLLPTIVASGPGYEGLTRRYALETCNAGPGSSWLPVPGFEDMPATGGTVTYTVPNPDEPGLYRARVWLE